MGTVTRSDLLIRLEDQQFPLTLEDVRQANPLVSFGDSLSEEDLTALGYAVVQPAEAPTGDVVVEVTPRLVEGVYTRSWTARDFTEQEKEDRFDITRNDYIAALERAVASALAVGMPYDFNGATYHVQLREKDKSNLLGLAYKSGKLIAAGASDVTMNFRPYENVALQLSATEMTAMCDAALSAFENVYLKLWALKDKADNAVYGDTFDAIPDSFFS